MSVVDEAIVREYFEAHGFLVRQHRKYVVSGREKRMDEEIDLLVFNPMARGAGRLPFFLGADDLAFIPAALIEIKGWHSERFGPSVIRKPDVVRFVKRAAEGAAPQSRASLAPQGREAESFFGGSKSLKRVLVLPELAADRKLRDQSVEMLKLHGIDGVLFFRNILTELIARIEKNKNYQKSELLQLLRILKTYDLLKDPQLELFGKKVRKRSRSK